MVTRRQKSVEGPRWPAGVVAAAALLLAAGPAARWLLAGPVGDGRAAAVEVALTWLLAPGVALLTRRAVDRAGTVAKGAWLSCAVVVLATLLHLSGAAAVSTFALGGDGSAGAFREALRASGGAQTGALLLGFAAVALADRLLLLGRRFQERGEALDTVREQASALAARGADAVRRLKDEAERRGRFERIHQHSRLEALRARLRPGFLVGVVDRARAAAADDPARAERMLLRLSLLLRTALREGEADLVPLSEEIERTDAVLELERERLGRRLKYRFDVPEELLDDPVPALLLVPLVLRAVAAGPGASKRGGRIDVRASCEDDRLVLEVQDDASPVVGADEARRDPELVALGERLRILYGGGARVRSGARVEGGTRLVIELPRVASVAREAS